MSKLVSGEFSYVPVNVSRDILYITYVFFNSPMKMTFYIIRRSKIRYKINFYNPEYLVGKIRETNFKIWLFQIPDQPKKGNRRIYSFFVFEYRGNNKNVNASTCPYLTYMISTTIHCIIFIKHVLWRFYFKSWTNPRRTACEWARPDPTTW